MAEIDLTAQEYDSLRNRIEEIYRKVDDLEKPTVDITFSNDELCEFLGISKKTAQKYRNEGLLKYLKKGKKISYRQKDVEEFLDNHRIAAIGD